jgi:excisionase family DNA binding protein
MANTDACVDDAQHPRWASPDDAAGYIGVTRRTIYNMCDDGRLTRHYLGRRILRIDLNSRRMLWGNFRSFAVAGLATLTLVSACTASTKSGPPSQSSTTTTMSTGTPTTTATSTPTSSASEPPAPAAGTRGMLSPISFWDQTFGTATSSECSMQGADILLRLRQLAEVLCL